MTTWHWVRHGPTHAKSFVGWRDVPADLSASDQIKRLRDHLPENAVVVSSDLSRARDTADAILGPGHRRLPHDPHLREMHFGLWDGLHFEAVEQRDPVLSRAFWEAPGDITAPGGESWNMTSARVAAAVKSISSRYPDQHIIAVAHFGVILTQLQRALAIAPYEALAQRIDNLSVTRIDWHRASATVPHINHLP
ncbi:histidine phosphatase family protein [Roseobacter weihaiensis]|uniref:histidine phosphatase family protein n=1 Tax=Roseobacter weihaiensis TaxID=2763262 RepID=UPI001D09CE84|nr:histidine phosphatase family protein [Roseobacter sp. H9]